MSFAGFLQSLNGGRQIQVARPREQFRPRPQAEPIRQGVGFNWGAGSIGGAGFDFSQPRRQMEVIPAPSRRPQAETMDLSGLNNPDMGFIQPGHDSGRIAASRPGRVIEVAPVSRGLDENDAVMSADVTASSRSVQPESFEGAGSSEILSSGGRDSAPTAGMRYMLPLEDPDIGDPRRGAFQTEAARVDDPFVSSVVMEGATSGVAPDLLASTANSLEANYGPGSRGIVTSGHRSGSAEGSDHNSGEAIDFYAVDRSGRESRATDPQMFDTARVAVARGPVQAVGIGDTYMGGRSVHFGTGRGQGRDYIRTWSDWNTGDEYARYGRQADRAGGAGDPNWNFAGELEDIQGGRQIVPQRQQLETTASARRPTATAIDADPQTRLMLARTLQAEAGNQGFEGMLDVGAVIRNRVVTGRWGDTVADVVMAPAQFSAWNGVTGAAGGAQGQNMDFQPSEDALRAADAILSGDYEDRTGGATHYYAIIPNVSGRPSWSNETFRRIDGDHYFGLADSRTPVRGNTGPIYRSAPTKQNRTRRQPYWVQKMMEAS
jgi:spore germination cell wall hydrolase CwlJ-like protein